MVTGELDAGSYQMGNAHHTRAPHLNALYCNTDPFGNGHPGYTPPFRTVAYTMLASTVMVVLLERKGKFTVVTANESDYLSPSNWSTSNPNCTGTELKYGIPPPWSTCIPAAPHFSYVASGRLTRPCPSFLPDVVQPSINTSVSVSPETDQRMAPTHRWPRARPPCLL